MLKYIFLLLLITKTLCQSEVYMTKVINSSNIVRLFKKLNMPLGEKIGLKVHSGEKGNQNFIRPEFMKPIVDLLDGTIVETTSSGPEYFGQRTTYEKHKKLLEEHGWTKVFKKVEILDMNNQIKK